MGRISISSENVWNEVVVFGIVYLLFFLLSGVVTGPLVTLQLIAAVLCLIPAVLALVLYRNMAD